MPKYLPGVTHTIITTAKNQDDMTSMKGMMAHVDLCFGPGDEHGIHGIGIRKMEGPVTGLTAHIPKTPMITTGKTTYTPVLSGKLAEEAKLLALVAFDRIKQVKGLKFGQKYRIVGTSIEELNPETKE